MTLFADQCLPVHHAGEQFLLHPDRVMYWPAQKILLAADVHMGKEHVFGRHGIAIPGGSSEATLKKLFELASNVMHAVLLCWVTFCTMCLTVVKPGCSS